MAALTCWPVVVRGNDLKVLQLEETQRSADTGVYLVQVSCRLAVQHSRVTYYANRVDPAIRCWHRTTAQYYG
jgi:hypothetical protein